MRLIDTETLQFAEFEGVNIPKYAILSHRWQEEEVLYKEFKRGTVRHKQGYHKILGFCAQALRDGLKYAWIDTCCIDKRSSAELTEAINSMYKWYENSAVCYVYLFDVNLPNVGVLPPEILASVVEDSLRSSQWFLRGWALQELVAPDRMEFFDSTWQPVGSKSQHCEALARISAIPVEVLERITPVHAIPIAERMSWASMRETTRLEDMAYCLMGIFGVNMPLLYGEGLAAFTRLQEEILKITEDDSFLLCDQKRLRALASSPRDFACIRTSTSQTESLTTESLPKTWYFNQVTEAESFSISNTGLLLRRPSFLWDYHNLVYIVLLRTYVEHEWDENTNICFAAFIFLRYLPHIKRFVRVKWQEQAAIYISRAAVKGNSMRAITQDFLISKTAHFYNDAYPFSPSRYLHSRSNGSQTDLDNKLSPPCMSHRLLTIAFALVPGSELAAVRGFDHVLLARKTLKWKGTVIAVSGMHEVQAVVRVRCSNEFYYLFAGYDNCLNPCVVCKNHDTVSQLFEFEEAVADYEVQTAASSKTAPDIVTYRHEHMSKSAPNEDGHLTKALYARHFHESLDRAEPGADETILRFTRESEGTGPYSIGVPSLVISEVTVRDACFVMILKDPCASFGTDAMSQSMSPSS